MPQRSKSSGPRRPAAQRPTRAARPRVALIVSRYNASITDELEHGALEQFALEVPDAPTPEVIAAPGSFELAVLAHAAAASGRFDGVVALGCIIKGETIHDEVLANALAAGLVASSLATGVPITMGVLTVNTPQQARARAGGELGNKGQEAMIALLDTLRSIAQIAGGPGLVRESTRRARPDKARTAGRSLSTKGARASAGATR